MLLASLEYLPGPWVDIHGMRTRSLGYVFITRQGVNAGCIHAAWPTTHLACVWVNCYGMLEGKVHHYDCCPSNNEGVKATDKARHQDGKGRSYQQGCPL